LNWVATFLYFATTSTTKLSILLLYSRLFSASASFRRQIIFISNSVISYWLGSTVANLLNCIPIEYTWSNSQADPRLCFTPTSSGLLMTSLGAFIDVFIALMPIGVIAKLQLSTTKKIVVGLVFLLGAL
jgi:hypothetical protein